MIYIYVYIIYIYHIYIYILYIYIYIYYILYIYIIYIYIIYIYIHIYTYIYTYILYIYMYIYIYVYIHVGYVGYFLSENPNLKWMIFWCIPMTKPHPHESTTTPWHATAVPGHWDTCPHRNSRRPATTTTKRRLRHRPDGHGGHGHFFST